MHSKAWILFAALAACHTNTNDAVTADAPQPGTDGSGQVTDAAADAATNGALPALTFCQVTGTDLSSAFTSQTGSGNDWVNYTCTTSCADWTTCVFDYASTKGPVMSARGGQMQALAFVVDGMAGHFVFTPDGDDVVVTHAGDGGTSELNPFDLDIQKISTLKTVSLGWETGTPRILAGGGWFTRKDANPRTTRDQVARPAAAIQWVKQNFAVGHKLGTVGSSMGTAATLGAHVWYGLEPIIDYQQLIGGPGYWDVNIGCGRVHVTAGHCDVDGAACTGTATSDFGNDDPLCGADPTNNCRVPTMMAPIADDGSAYNNVINYVGATTSCMPLTTDARDPELDASSLAATVQDWSFHGPIDFVTNEGGTQPPNADQGMGEGHMLEIYSQIQTTKSWTDNQGYHHGDSWDTIPALMMNGAALVKAGMGQP